MTVFFSILTYLFLAGFAVMATVYMIHTAKERNQKTMVELLICGGLILAAAATGALAGKAAVGYALLMILALLLFAVVFVMHEQEESPRFLAGFFSALVANVIFSMAFAQASGMHWLDILFFIGILALFILVPRIAGLRIETLKVPAVLAAISATLMLTKAFSLLYVFRLPAACGWWSVAGTLLLLGGQAVVALPQFSSRFSRHRIPALILSFAGQIALVLGLMNASF